MRIFIALSALLLAFVQPAPALAQCGGANCALADHPFFDEQAFANAVGDTLGTNFPGYGVALIDQRGSTLVRIWRGEATKAGDPEGSQLFTSLSTKSRIGSVSKIVTVATALRLIEERADAGVNISPRTRIRDVAPAFFVDNLNPVFDDVRLDDLMRHTHGFPRDHGGQELWQIAAGPAVAQAYSNVGVDLLGFLLPFIADPTLLDLEATLSNPAICGTTTCIEDLLQDIAYGRYLELAQALILEPAGIDADCLDDRFQGQSGTTVARAYVSAGSATGNLTDRSRVSCPSGGWMMTAWEMAQLGHALGRNTQRLMSAESYALMEAPTGQALGWNPPAASPGPNAPLFDRVWTHGGRNDLGTPTRSYAARLIRLPNGMSAAALVNSQHPVAGAGTSGFLRDALTDGYEAGATGAAAQAAAAATSILVP